MDQWRTLTQRPVGDAHPVLGLGVLDALLHGGDIVRLWSHPVSVSPDGSGHQQGWLVRQEALAAVAAIVRPGGVRLGDELIQSDPELDPCHKIADHHFCLSR